MDQLSDGTLHFVNCCDLCVEVGNRMARLLLESRNVIVVEVKKSDVTAGTPACSLNRIHGEESRASHPHNEICLHIAKMIHGDLAHDALMLKLCAFFLSCVVPQSALDDA